MMSIRYLLLFLGTGFYSGLQTSHASVDEHTLKAQLQAIYKRAGENRDDVGLEEIAGLFEEQKQEHVRNTKKDKKKLAKQRRQEQYSKDCDQLEENNANLEELSKEIKRKIQQHQKQQHQRNLKGMLIVPKNR